VARRPRQPSTFTVDLSQTLHPSRSDAFESPATETLCGGAAGRSRYREYYGMQPGRPDVGRKLKQLDERLRASARVRQFAPEAMSPDGGRHLNLIFRTSFLPQFSHARARTCK
jgi:hypothetical protein